MIGRLDLQTFGVLLLARSILCSISAEWHVNSNSTLVQALMNLSTGDKIIIQDGIYSGPYVCNNTIKVSNVSIQAANKGNVTIDCGSTSRHFAILGSSVTIFGITMLNGFSKDPGGCLYVNGSGLLLQYCSIRRCTTTSTGGGIMLAATGAEIVLYNSQFSACSALSGGAIYLNLASRLLGQNVIIEYCAAALYGGGIYLNTASSMTVSETSVLRGNTANTRGGAIYSATKASITFGGSVLFIKNAVVSTSGSVAPYGGAIYAIGSSLTTSDGSSLSFTGNTCVYVGGAVVLSSSSALEVNGQLQFVGAARTCFSICFQT